VQQGPSVGTGQHVARGQQRHLRLVPQDGDAAGHLGAGLGDRLADLPHHQRDDVVRGALERLRAGVQGRAADRGRRTAPPAGGRARPLEGPADLLPVRRGQPDDDVGRVVR
jgi:hypothetical protein